VATTDETLPDVTLIDVAANLFRGSEAVGGRIQITTHRVRFKPHSINIQKEPAEIDLQDVTEVGPRNTLGIVPNGMFVRTKDGTEYRFVVWGRGNLIKTIQAASKDRIEGKIEQPSNHSILTEPVNRMSAEDDPTKILYSPGSTFHECVATS